MCQCVKALPATLDHAGQTALCLLIQYLCISVVAEIHSTGCGTPKGKDKSTEKRLILFIRHCIEKRLSSTIYKPLNHTQNPKPLTLNSQPSYPIKLFLKYLDPEAC